MSNGLFEVSGGDGSPESLLRDQLHIEHDNSADPAKIIGVWAGTLAGVAKVIFPMAVQFPGDGNNYSMEPTDKHVGANTTSSTATITLPETDKIEDGHEVSVEDHGGNAGANNITIETPGDESVETSTISSDDGLVRLLWDKENTNWKDVS